MDSRKAITDGDEVADQRSGHNTMKALESSIRLQKEFDAHKNKHNALQSTAYRSRAQPSQPISKTYDSETSNTVSANTDINVKRRNQPCTDFSDFVLGVKNVRHQARSRPDQGQWGAQRSLEVFRNSSRLKKNPHSAANSIT